MRKTYGPVKNQDASCGMRSNEEIDLLIRHANLVRYMKAHRIRTIGHIVSMDKEMTAERITEWIAIAERKIGSPR